jgi:hypothetical protein
MVDKGTDEEGDKNDKHKGNIPRNLILAALGLYFLPKYQGL